LIEAVVDLLDLSRERAHLVFELTEAHFVIDRTLCVGRAHRDRRAARTGAAIDLPLQQVHVALEAIQSVEQRAHIRALRGGDAGDAERHAA